MLLFMALAACSGQREEPITTPWGEVLDSIPTSDDFDLSDIQQAGEMILLTLRGPATYYDYRGQQLGLRYLVAQRFADHLGVRLRVDICRDTVEMRQRLIDDDPDLTATRDTIYISGDKPALAKAFKAWYSPRRLAEIGKEEKRLLATGGVRRRVFSPMLNRQGGVISRYDGLFVQYAREIHWDWRLLAAQCYQESCFDPLAVSFAGAKGLMQIMPSTASTIGLPAEKLFEPQQNIAGAVKFIAKLENTFSDIPKHERQNFVLASYNGGSYHIRDAMALARRDGKNERRWVEVAPYVLRLSEPQYYQDPLVKNGYMRGSETVDYVQKIRQRYQQYRGVKGPSGGLNFTPQKAQNQKHRQKFQ